jgi:hypothetical protein
MNKESRLRWQKEVRQRSWVHCWTREIIRDPDMPWLLIIPQTLTISGIGKVHEEVCRVHGGIRLIPFDNAE